MTKRLATIQKGFDALAHIEKLEKRVERVIKIARYWRTESIINGLLITKREQDQENQIKELEEKLRVEILENLHLKLINKH